MPTPQNLQRLQALLTQLNTIANVQSGELIRAGNWNTLVGSVINLAQAVLASDLNEAVPPHEHPDQVSNAWLVPQLRELLERGPLADPAAQARLLELEARLKRLADKLEGNRDKFEEFRGRLRDVVTRDLEREVAVTNVRRVLDNVVDPRPDILAFRNTLSGIQRDMGTVLEAASQLTVGDAVVDLGTLVNQVADMMAFRERFRFGNGELLDAITIEQRLAEVTNRFVSNEQVDDLIRNRPVEIPDERLAAIETNIGNDLRGQVNGTLQSLTEQLRAEVDERLNSVGNLVGVRVTDAIPGIVQTVSNNLTGTIQTARMEAVNEAVALVRTDLNSQEESFRADLDRRLTQLRTNISETVRNEVGQRVTVELGALLTDVSNLGSRVATLSGETERTAETVKAHTTQIAGLPQEIANIRNDLRQTLLTEIDVRISNVRRTLDTQIMNFERSQNDRLDVVSADIRRQALEAANQIAATTAQNESRALRTQLIAEMRAVAREEVSISVSDRVNVAVRDAVRTEMASVPALISAEVGRLNRPGGRIGGRVLGGGGVR